MLVYICDGLEDSDLGPGGECRNQSDAINHCLGELLIGTWAVGGTVSGIIFWCNIIYIILYTTEVDDLAKIKERFLYYLFLGFHLS